MPLCWALATTCCFRASLIAKAVSVGCSYLRSSSGSVMSFLRVMKHTNATTAVGIKLCSMSVICVLCLNTAPCLQMPPKACSTHTLINCFSSERLTPSLASARGDMLEPRYPNRHLHSFYFCWGRVLVVVLHIVILLAVE